jgi:VWFA-related protein
MPPEGTLMPAVGREETSKPPAACCLATMPAAVVFAAAALALLVNPAGAGPQQPRRPSLGVAGDHSEPVAPVAGGQLPEGHQQAQNPTPGFDPSQLARGGGFTASVEMVRVPVVVIDGRNEFVRSLGESDFAVRDGGRTYRVEHFVADTEPTAVGILVDSGSDMAPYLDDLRRAVTTIAAELRANNELFLIGFAGHVETLAPLTTDRLEIAAALERLRPVQDADARRLYDAAAQGLRLLGDARHDKRSLIVIGAGLDLGSRIGELDLQRAIHDAGVTIHAIDMSAPGAPSRRAREPRVNRVQTLPELVRFSGGLLARRPAVPERFGGVGNWLESAGASISRYVNHQYLLHYTPLDPPRTGSWRTIRVEVTGNYKEVRARSGYMR